MVAGGLLTMACTADVLPNGAPTGGAGTGARGGSGGEVLGCAVEAIQPGRSPLRRLNHGEYDATLRDLLGEQPHSHSFPPDEQGAGFSNNADALVVSGLLAEGYLNAAAKLAKNAVTQLSTLSACDALTAGEGARAERFVREVGKSGFTSSFQPAPRTTTCLRQLPSPWARPSSTTSSVIPIFVLGHSQV